jgi:predicted permease
MSLAVLLKLLAIFVVVAIGYVAGRMRWLTAGAAGGPEAARLLSNAAFYLFVPALLIRTTARLNFGAMPWVTLAAFFVPVLGLLLGVYAWERTRLRRRLARGEAHAAAPSVRAISATFGNTVQVGVPMASALFGEAGLAVHVTIISLHALTLLLVLTTLVELDLARAHAAGRGLWPTLRLTLRNTIIHPVVLPVLTGMAWNLTGWPMPAVADEVLQLLGSAVVPLCLVLIGLSLAVYGVHGAWRGALGLSLLKLLLLPAVVLGVGRFGVGLRGLPLAVVVMAAALPVGSNALIFSQRYEALEAEASAAIVFSTFLFTLTAPLWLLVLAALPP